MTVTPLRRIDNSALTHEDLQAIQELLAAERAYTSDMMDAKLEPILEQLGAHNQNITTLERRITHELRLLNESLPDALAKREAFENMSAKVENHDNRIFALEQKISNG